MLERSVHRLARGIVGDEYLDSPARILQRREARLAHHALEHHAPGDRDLNRLRLEYLAGELSVGRMQIGREMLAPEVVRKGDARLSQLGELCASLRDDLVLVLMRLIVF